MSILSIGKQSAEIPIQAELFSVLLFFYYISITFIPHNFFYSNMYLNLNKASAEILIREEKIDRGYV